MRLLIYDEFRPEFNMHGDELIFTIEGKNKLDCYLQLINEPCDFAEVFNSAWECLKEIFPEKPIEELANKAILIASNGLKNSFDWKEN